MKDIHGGNIWEASKEASVRPGELLDFSASINPLGLPAGAATAIKDAVRLVPPYPEPYAETFRESLSGFHSIPPDEILPANGSTQLIHMIPNVLRPASALIVEPAFSEYRSSLAPSGCGAEGFMLKEADGFALDLKKLARRLAKGADVLYIANPANPTGALIKKDALIEVAGMCASAGATLVVDEAFADFTEDESIKQEAGRLKNVIVLRSMTKFFAMAGLRLGFMVSNRRLVKRFSNLMPPWSVNTLASVAAVAALKDAAYQKAAARWIRTERPFLFNGLGEIPGLAPFPSAANFFMVRITRPSVTAASLKAALLKEGILVRDLSTFRCLGPQYFRVAVRKRKENAALIEALRGAVGG